LLSGEKLKHELDEQSCQRRRDKPGIYRESSRKRIFMSTEYMSTHHMPTRYKVIFKGKLIDGFSQEQVKQDLAKTFNLDSAKAEKYFTGKSFTIKKGVDEATANKFERVFANIGAIVEIESEQTEPSALDGLSLVPMEEKKVEEPVAEEAVYAQENQAGYSPAYATPNGVQAPVEYLEESGVPVLVYLGYACYAFAIADLGLYLLDIADLTGVSWSPIAASILGSILVKIGRGE